MFIGRERELALLEQCYDSNKLECAVVYGRRRVGKTTLIAQFVKDKPHVMFAALDNSLDNNLRAFSSAIALAEHPDLTEERTAFPVYDSFSDALNRVFAMAQDKPMVLVIDEYPYLANADPSASSVLQHAIDAHLSNRNLMIILSGSSMSFMERQVLGYKSPLYGRRTASLKIEPFDYLSSLQFIPNMSAEDGAVVYGLTNGIPQYLIQFNDSMSLQDNIARNMLTNGCYLLDEPDNLMKQELRKPAEYNNIIEAIAHGASRLNEIAGATGIVSGTATKYLDNLIDLGIVTKETPFGNPKTRRPLYSITDSFFRFWYRYVPQNLPLIHSGRPDIAARLIMDELPRFMGPVFERMCTQWLWHVNDTNQLPFLITNARRWWGSNPTTKQQEEIDIVASTIDPDAALFCECKWRNKPTGMEELHTLQSRSQLLPYQQRRYMLFSKAGFTEELQQYANTDETIQLVSFENMTR